MKRNLLCVLLFILVFITGCSSGSIKTSDKNVVLSTENECEELTDTDLVDTSEEKDDKILDPTKEIDKVVEEINSKSKHPLELHEDFTPSDKESGHYRTEFRLNVYREAVGKSYLLDDTVVDIVATCAYSGDLQMRIYMDSATLEQCKDIIKYASKAMDSSATESIVNETLDYVDENESANGYYYADKLSLLLFKRGKSAYEFMLKYE